MNEALRNFCILLIAIICIWFLGPLLAFDGHVFLAQDDTRFLLILICTLIWGGNNLYLKLKRKKQSESGSAQPSQRTKKTQLIKSYQSALTLIHQISTVPSDEPPCYLLIGHAKSGKSELLHHAGMKCAKTHPSTPYHWWLNPQGMFIEMNTMTNPSVLSARIKLLHELKSKRQQPLTGVLLVFSLRELLIQDQTALTTQMNQVKDLLHPLSELNIPITLVISHCDLIAGFNDFFAPLEPEERQQVFGVNLALKQQNTNVINRFNHEFPRFIDKLMRNVIRAIDASNQSHKQLVNDFPQQLESLQPLLRSLLKQCLTVAANIQGLYFISNMQQGTPRNFIQETIQQAWAFAPRQKPTPQTVDQDQSYFIQMLFAHLLQAPTANTNKRLLQQPWLYYLTGVVSLSVIALGSFFWYQSYRNNLAEIKSVNQHIARGATVSANASRLDMIFTRLNQLSPQINTINSNPPWVQRFSFHTAQRLQTAIHHAYQQNLVYDLLPTIKTTLEKQLQLADKPTKLYDTLSAYLMLGNPQALHDPENQQFIASLLTNFWQTTPHNLTRFDSVALTQHLNHLWQLSPQLPLDQRLIHISQQRLAKIPLPQLVFYSLNQYLHVKPITLSVKNPLLSNSKTFVIPAQYTAKYAHKMFFEIIPEACKTFIEDDRVLREKPDLNATSLNALIHSVRQRYLQQYVKTWGQVLAHIKITSFATTKDAALALSTETKKPSPLLTLLLQIQYNTAPMNDVPGFDKTVSNQFKEVNDLVTQLRSAPIQKALRQLSDYLKVIADDQDPLQAAFDAAKRRMTNNGQNDPIAMLKQAAQNAPDLLYSWLNSMANNSWKAILDDTSRYINQAWKETVLPQYEIDINHRFPVFKDANSNISLTAFSAFFGPGGTMEQFFMQYLKPFVMHEKIYWNWREVDGQYLDISQSSLDSFIRASLIRKMFFAGDSAEPHIRFTLQLKSLSNQTRLLVVNLDGRTKSFTANNRDVVDFNWPGSNPDSANFHIESLSGQPEILSAQGPWALFRLMEKVKLKTNLNTQKFQLDINLKGAGGQFTLTAGNVINPFIPGVVSSFRAPKSL